MGFQQRGFAWGNKRGFAVELAELLVEEQIQHNSMVGLDGTNKNWAGQVFPVAPINRKVAKLAFKVIKIGAPAGNVTFAVVNQATGIAINSKVWGDAAGLPTNYPHTEWQEVTFDSPLLIDVIARMCVLFSGGDGGNQVAPAIQTSDVKANEYAIYDVVGSQPAVDFTYRYSYYE